MALLNLFGEWVLISVKNDIHILYINMYTYMYINVYVYMYTDIYVYMCVYINVYDLRGEFGYYQT